MMGRISFPAEVAKMGNSKGVIIPFVVARNLGLEAGDLVKISVEKLTGNEEE